MVKAQARVKIYEEENIDQWVALKTPTMTDIKAGDSRYPLMSKKQKYLDQNEKSSAATHFQDRPSVNKFSTINIQHGSYRISNTICKNNKEVSQQIKIKSQAGSENLVRKTMRLVRCYTNLPKSNQHLVWI